MPLSIYSQTSRCGELESVCGAILTTILCIDVRYSFSVKMASGENLLFCRLENSLYAEAIHKFAFYDLLRRYNISRVWNAVLQNHEVYNATLRTALFVQQVGADRVFFHASMAGRYFQNGCQGIKGMHEGSTSYCRISQSGILWYAQLFEIRLKCFEIGE